MKKTLVLSAVVFLFFGFAIDSFAGDAEKALSHDLAECSRIISRLAGSGNTPTVADIARIRNIAEAIHADRLLLVERHGALAERAATLGGKAAERQEAVSSVLLKNLDELLLRLDALGTGITPADLDSLKQLLDSLVPKKSRPLLGVLPYKHANYPPREPASTPVVKPAYKGGERNVYATDTATTSEAPISQEIVDLAQSLQWNPVLIYEWVKNNVETEWYWGSMKGAEETLRQKSGNDADQASLLVALLRAANFPARYVRGTIDFFPGMERARNLTGLDDPLKIADFFRKGGIPFKPVIAGGGISNFQIEHIWVEAFIPYANYRGAVVDDQGKIWLGLDTSIKPLGYTRIQGAGVPADLLVGLRDDYLNAVQTLTPLDYLTVKLDEQLALNQPGKSWKDLKDTAVLIPDVLKIIPDSMQFNQIAITGEYQALPDELKHKLTITATAGGNALFSLTLETHKLSNKKLAIKAEPETVEDQNTIDSFGGLDNTPAYLVRLRPVLTLDDERLIVAQDGLPMGADFTLNIDIVTPNGTERISSGHIAGNLSVIGVVAQKAATPAVIADTDDAEAILHKEAIGYIGRWNRAEEELAGLLGQRVSRPAVAIATVGGQMEVTTILDTTHDMQWQGVYLDAGYKRIETTGRNGQEKEFMRLSALQGSVLENRIFEDDLKVDSISTAKLMQLAKTNGTSILTIDKTSIDTILPTLPFDDAVKTDIANAVNQNLTVTIPQNEVAYQDWSGIGYIKENNETGESGWMLSGNVAGGMTAVTPAQWANQYIAARLRAPYALPPNMDPLSAVRILKIPVNDKQDGIVDKPLASPLAVLVLDSRNRPVYNAQVTFRIMDGGGNFAGVQSISTTTNWLGIAYAALTLGQKTDGNPGYLSRSGDTNLTQVGINSVSALVSGSAGTIQLEDRFLAYAWPDAPVSIVKSLGDWNSALANNPAGSLVARVTDRFGNPVSNVPLSFTPATPQSRNPYVPLPTNARNVTLYQSSTCNVAYPLYGDCATLPNLTIKTDYIGAVANVILGNSVDTLYTVRASASGLPSSDFTLFSEGTRGAAGDYIPPGLYIRSLLLVDSIGRPINAAKAGQSLAAPLVSELFLMQDSVTLTPSDSGMWHLSWSGLVTTKPVKDGNVVYQAGSGTVSATSNLQNGRYQATYTTPTTPGINLVHAYGVYDVKVPRVLTTNFINGPSYLPGFSGYAANPNLFGTSQLTISEYRTSDLICDNTGCRLPDVTVTLQSGQQPVFFSTQPDGIRIAGTQQTTDYTVNGVTTTLTVQPKAIPVTSEGFTRSDARISYTIQPQGYVPQIVDIDLFENNTYIGTYAGNNGLATIYAGTKLDLTKTYRIQAVLNRGGSAEIKGDMVDLPLVLGLLVPDYNHNRKIEEDDIARAANGDTYYFWVNDDDGNGDTEGSGIPGSRDNTPNITIPGTRNLVNWFPVYLNIKPVVDKYSPSTYRYALTSTSGQLKFVYSTLTSINSGTYLTDVPTAQGLTIGAGPRINEIANFGGLANPLASAFIESIRISGNGIILVEGVGKSVTPLVLAVYDPDNKVVFNASLNLSIDGVEQMYRHVNLIQAIDAPNAPSLASGSGGELNRLSKDDFTNKLHFEGFDVQNDDKYFVLLHGVNVSGNDARGWHAEMFKRLYWAGSKARFVGVSWYSTDGPSWGYYPNVVHAFETAEIFGPKLKSVVGNSPVTIMAHSLGNMVVSSYLADHFQKPVNQLNVTSYLMFNAAVALESYIGDYTGYGNGQLYEQLGPENTMVHSDWFGYQRRFSASEWYQHFAANDGRTKLTWRNRFAALPESIRYINFFSSGEDILATYSGTQPAPSDLISFDLSRNSWVLQEKWKGRPIGLAGSEYMGWGFNLSDVQYNPYLMGHLDSTDANLTITGNNQLISRPFFQKTAPTGIASVLFSDAFVDFTVIKPYNNSLLTYAMPALTTATGGWAGGEMISNKNFVITDMNLKKDNSTWPRREQTWNHSDIKDVAFPFVYKVIDELAIKGALQ